MNGIFPNTAEKQEQVQNSREISAEVYLIQRWVSYCALQEEE